MPNAGKSHSGRRIGRTANYFAAVADRAPITVNNFVFLAEQGYYDGTSFHRVLVDFMAQGGDPTGTGGGGPGYRFADEIDLDTFFDEAGYFAMANGGPDSNGSQFFITVKKTPWLNKKHTIFGEVVSGFDVVEKIENAPVDSKSKPKEEQKIIKAYIK